MSGTQHTVIKSICCATAISLMPWASSWVLQQARVGQVPCSLSFSRQLPRKARAGVSAFSERGFQRTVAFGSALG